MRVGGGASGVAGVHVFLDLGPHSPEPVGFSQLAQGAIHPHVAFEGQCDGMRVEAVQDDQKLAP